MHYFILVIIHSFILNQVYHVSVESSVLYKKNHFNNLIHQQLKKNNEQLQKQRNRFLYDNRYRSTFEEIPFLNNNFHSFLFSCEGLNVGFYADIYNGCKFFFLCHEPKHYFFRSNNLAITTYSCPEFTYFNQKQLACTRLEDFDLPCENQYILFNNNDFKKNKLIHKQANSKPIASNEFKNKTNIEIKNSDKNLTESFYDDDITIDKLLSLDKNKNNLLTTEKMIEINTKNPLFEESNINESISYKNSDEKLNEKPKNEVEDYNEFIETTFDCDGYTDGYYADILHECRVFHVCQNIEDESNKKIIQTTFRCPDGTVFNQALLTCTTESDLQLPCEQQEKFYLN